MGWPGGLPRRGARRSWLPGKAQPALWQQLAKREKVAGEFLGHLGYRSLPGSSPRSGAGPLSLSFSSRPTALDSRAALRPRVHLFLLRPLLPIQNPEFRLFPNRSAEQIDIRSRLREVLPMKVSECQPLDNFRVYLRFDNGVSGEVDLSHLRGKGVFAAWEDPRVFNKVLVTSQGALEWPGEIDLCPDALYLRLAGASQGEITCKPSRTLTHA